MYIGCEEDHVDRDRKKGRRGRLRTRALVQYVTLSCSLALRAKCCGCHVLVRSAWAAHGILQITFFSPTEFTTQDDDDDRKKTDVIGDVMIETKQD